MLLGRLVLSEYGQLKILTILLPQINTDYQYYLLKALEDIYSNPPPIRQGINSMMEQLINLRSILYAFQNLGEHAFLMTSFFKVFHQTITYAIFSLFGKLVDGNSNVTSLKNAWKKADKFLEKSEETKDIYQWITTKPLSLRYRHEMISHANYNTNIHEAFSWEDFDADFDKLVIAWRILHEFLEMPLIHHRLLGKTEAEKDIFESVKNFSSEDVDLLLKQYYAFVDKHVF